MVCPKPPKRPQRSRKTKELPWISKGSNNRATIPQRTPRELHNIQDPSQGVPRLSKTPKKAPKLLWKHLQTSKNVIQASKITLGTGGRALALKDNPPAQVPWARRLEDVCRTNPRTTGTTDRWVGGFYPPPYPAREYPPYSLTSLQYFTLLYFYFLLLLYFNFCVTLRYFTVGRLFVDFW